VQDKVEKAREAGEAIDYLTSVPDGESTLDINPGREIELLKALDLPVAVITNASLIWRQDVREGLMSADWVSLKVDSDRDYRCALMNKRTSVCGKERGGDDEDTDSCSIGWFLSG